MKHYLMIKTHNLTNLKYLCKTSTKDPLKPYKYLGSGKYWKRHLNKHGRDVKTEILEICETRKELTKKGIYYSKLYNVVNSKEFANIIEERGDGGPTMLGRKITFEQNKRKSKSLRKFYKHINEEYRLWRKKLNSKCHEMRTYITPNGTYTNSFTAAAANNCSNVTIINRCVKNTDKPIESKKYWKYGWRNKTWKELGWYNLPLNAQSFVPND